MEELLKLRFAARDKAFKKAVKTIMQEGPPETRLGLRLDNAEGLVVGEYKASRIAIVEALLESLQLGDYPHLEHDTQKKAIDILRERKTHLEEQYRKLISETLPARLNATQVDSLLPLDAEVKMQEHELFNGVKRALKAFTLSKGATRHARYWNRILNHPFGAVVLIAGAVATTVWGFIKNL